MQMQTQYEQQFSAPTRHDKASIMALYNLPATTANSPTTVSAPYATGQNHKMRSATMPALPALNGLGASMSIYETNALAGQLNSPIHGTIDATTSKSTVPLQQQQQQPQSQSVSRNPFVTQTASTGSDAVVAFQAQSQQQSPALVHPSVQGLASSSAGRQISRESVDFVGLMNGRHSPDAFTILSSRVVK